MPKTSRVSFDIDDIPFSTRGSWLNLSRVIGLHKSAPDIHLVTHQNGHQNGLTGVLGLTVRRNGSKVDATVQANSSVLSWVDGEERVEAVFDGPEILRLTGQGLTMRLEDAVASLTPFTGTFFYYDPASKGWCFTSYETGLRYRITVLKGTLSAAGAEALGQAERWVEVSAPHGKWEIAIDEFRTTREPLALPTSFDGALEKADNAFANYLDRIAPWRNSQTPAASLAAYVLYSATVSPLGFLERESVLMSKHWMDKVWSWDHCFNAIALAEGHAGEAWDQFLAPFDHQTPEGALPDSISHSELLYNYVKPPIHGWAYSKLRQSQPVIDSKLLAEIYGALSRWTGFWIDHRTSPGRELPYYQHGNDSGWDNSTTFDRDRLIESPDLAAFLIFQLDVLIEIAQELNSSLEGTWRGHRERIFNGLMNLWDGSVFRAYAPITGRWSTSTSLLNLLPLLISDRLPAEIGQTMAVRLAEHLTEWGPATEPPASPHYEPDGYWRGPIWAPSTYLIEDGLRRGGYTDMANAISSRFRSLCETSGFAENFDALSGEGLRDRAYTWTASTYLALAADAVRRSDDGQASAAAPDELFVDAAP
jgi:hypothetical protein